MKNKAKQESVDTNPAKKLKTNAEKQPKKQMVKRTIENETPKKANLKETKPGNKAKTTKKPQKILKKPLKPPYDKLKAKKVANTNILTEKPADWNEFKKQKKELRQKRRSSRGLIDVITKAKEIGEKLRVKKLEGSIRSKLVQELHTLLRNEKETYVKYVLSHDMARIVQYMFKFGSEQIRNDISQEIIPSTVLMLQSKYGKFVVKRMLKYGNATIRSNCLQACYGNAVKLASHAVSAPIFEFAYTTYASPVDKASLIQEFFGDMYKQTKDSNIKHLRDVYKDSKDMKTAALGATKANLTRILNKDLLDSALVQSVLAQFLSECSDDDRAELVAQLAPHIVILSNSKDGAKVAMNCIWHGTNKDRKTAIKALKEHIIDLCKHEHAHCAVIALLDAVDDTVLLNKALLSELLPKAEELVADDWGRKVLLWLVSPADTAHFHPQFIRELEEGRANSSVKKESQVRRKEILMHCCKALLETIADNAGAWLRDAKRSVVTLAILKSGQVEKEVLKVALESISKVIVDPLWNCDGENETNGIEDSGIHMTLKKLARNDKDLDGPTFGEALVAHLTPIIVENWIKTNRGCFLLVSVLENNSKAVQSKLKSLLSEYRNSLSKLKFTGAKILHSKTM